MPLFGAPPPVRKAKKERKLKLDIAEEKHEKRITEYQVIRNEDEDVEVQYVAFEGEEDDVQWLSPEDETDVSNILNAEESNAMFDEEEGGAEEVSRIAGKKLPAEVRCFDTARIYVKAGDGGRGCVAFRREKFVPKGGPSGGNGGNGGSVYIEADSSLNSLTSFRRQVHFRASAGTPGMGSDMHGANAKDLVIKVPPGTIVRKRGARPDDPPLAEILKEGEKALLAIGGRGGRGNLAFKSARNNAPTIAEFGEKGKELWLDLELKLVADAGIVGVPNAGKSTLLSVLSAAKPKVADYPFTTLTPNLGVNDLDYRTTVFADVPGLLEGAHSGVGLGHQFLRHCQRCKVLVHVVDGTSPDPLGDFDAIQTELRLFNPELAEKPQVVAYNKMDVPDSADYWSDIKEGLLQRGVSENSIFAISAVAQSGVNELVRKVHNVLDELPAEDERMAPVITSGEIEEEAARRDDARIGEFRIEAQLSGPRVFIVHGDAIERFTQMTDWSYYEATRRFQGVLDASGITKALKAKGIQEGDTVVIGDMEFEHSDDVSEGAMYDKWASERRMAGIANRGSARWPHAGG